MGFDLIVCGIIACVLIAYLGYVMLRPEKF